MYKVILSVLLLASCAHSGVEYGDSLQQWIGQSETSLNEAWGTPENVFNLTTNRKVVTFLRVDDSAVGYDNKPYSSEVAYGAISNPTWGNPQYTEHYCKTSFTILDGQVVNYSFNGDDCVTD